jgi:hypothetical protein
MYMATLDLWLLSFKAKYHELTGSLPLIHAGQDPAHDLAVVTLAGPGREYWLTYPIEHYDSDYWSVFLTMFDHDSVKINLSSALLLTEHLLGPHAFDLAIPDVWVLSVEILDTQESRII